jgi:hypothetical protein
MFRTEGGYQKYMMGKWHVGGKYPPHLVPEHAGNLQHPLPVQRGFDQQYGTLGGAGSYYNPPSLVQDEALLPSTPDGLLNTYAAMIDLMDQGIGGIIQTLNDVNEFDNTIIIFLSDNGGCAEFLKEDSVGAWCENYATVSSDGIQTVVGNDPNRMPRGRDYTLRLSDKEFYPKAKGSVTHRQRVVSIRVYHKLYSIYNVVAHDPPIFLHSSSDSAVAVGGSKMDITGHGMRRATNNKVSSFVEDDKHHNRVEGAQRRRNKRRKVNRTRRKKNTAAHCVC